MLKEPTSKHSSCLHTSFVYPLLLNITEDVKMNSKKEIQTDMLRSRNTQLLLLLAWSILLGHPYREDLPFFLLTLSFSPPPHLESIGFLVLAGIYPSSRYLNMPHIAEGVRGWEGVMLNPKSTLMIKSSA